MSVYKILKELKGEHWNLKVGCHYEIADQIAANLVASESIEPVIETAMAPAPGANKRVRKSFKSNSISSDPRRNQTPPTSDD
tara:strand:- start:1525 stop:1770 length:246 start_codon:yes stop_codon:yes gene_type:complete